MSTATTNPFHDPHVHIIVTNTKHLHKITSKPTKIQKKQKGLNTLFFLVDFTYPYNHPEKIEEYRRLSLFLATAIPTP
jgi:hypothetical protein